MKIDLSMIAEALEPHGEIVWYLDRKTGDVVPSFEDQDGISEGFSDELETNREQFLIIDPLDSDEGFLIMEDFIDSLEKGEASRSLQRAITGPRPFASFKQALHDFPEERSAWFKFHQERMLEHARGFLRHNEIEFEEPKP